MESLVLPAPPTPLGAGGVARLRRARAARLAKRLAALGRDKVGAAVVGVLETLARSSPDELVELVSDPGVGVLIDSERTEDALAVLGFELACRRKLTHPVEVFAAPLWSARSDRLFQPDPTTLGVRLQERLTTRDTAGNTHDFALDTVPVENPGGRMLAAFPEILTGVALALFDPNPLKLVEAHPEKQGNQLSLGDRPLAEWIASLRSAFSVIERHLPELFAEMTLLLRWVVPTGAHAERQLSASYREYVGALYLTLHPEPLSTAEALIHEFQHNKLNLCAQHYDLIENAYSPLYPSPIRPDPRPLMGVLLAAHAFVPVAELYRRLLALEPSAAPLTRRLSEVIAANDEALRTLGAHARFTPAGEHVFDDLSGWHAQHLALGLTLPSRASHVA